MSTGSDACRTSAWKLSSSIWMRSGLKSPPIVLVLPVDGAPPVAIAGYYEPSAVFLLGTGEDAIDRIVHFVH